MQGWRISMEDAHTAVLDLLANNPKAAKEHRSKLSFFGVFDGHGGDKVALFAGENIHNIVTKQDTFKAGNYEQALKDGFLATDRAILNGTVVPVPFFPHVPLSTSTSHFSVFSESADVDALEQIPNTRRRYRVVRLAWA
jgi:serine/threonine protein phosphatase PrpC